MINGNIRDREAIIELEVSGPDQLRQIEAVIDTGYIGYLTLPADLVTSLQLPFAGHRRGMLADGSGTLSKWNAGQRASGSVERPGRTG